MNPYETGELERGLDLDFAHRQAEKALVASSINMYDFKDIYDVKADEKHANELEKQYEARYSPARMEQKKLADILEAILIEQIELQNWLGENVETTKTTKYDDIENKIDVIVEFKEEERRALHLGLALDITFAIDVEKKLQQIKEGIEKGKLPKIKYFKSEHMGYRGELSELPEVVIGVDRDKAQEMTQAWVSKDRKRLNNLPIRDIILSEILMQLESFKNYALTKKQPNIAKRYEQVEKIIKSVIGHKTITPETDRVHRSIESALRNI